MRQGYAFAAIMIAATIAAAPSPAQVNDARTFIMKAGASDLYERQSSELVLNSTDPQIRSFAQEMIKDHTESTSKVKAAAAQAHIPVPPPHLDAAQAGMIARLRAAKGKARDQIYIAQQKTAHQQALALHRGYATGGDTPSLKKAASEIVPVIEHHIQMLDRIGGR